jgi:hypothetical protein
MTATRHPPSRSIGAGVASNKIDLSRPDPGFVRKVGNVDLLDIRDPEGRARTGAVNGVFACPLVTIEDVDVVDAGHIVGANDNGLPFSSGRSIGRTTTSSSRSASRSSCTPAEGWQPRPASRGR